MVRWGVVGGGIALVAVVVWFDRTGSQLEMAELRSLDYRFRLRCHARRPVEHVLLVAIDERSLAARGLGGWPWDRAIHAKLVHALARRGAAAIVFDVFFTDPGRTAQGDRELVEAVRRAGKVFAATRPVAGDEEVEPYSMDDRLAIPIDPAQLADAPHVRGFASLMDGLGESVAGVGYTDVIADPDGVCRRFYPIRVCKSNNRAYLFLPLVVHRVLRGTDAFTRVCVKRGRYATISPLMRPIPVDRWGRAFLDYSGCAIPTVSCVDVLRGALSDAEVRGRICVIGATAAGLYDVHPTSVNPRTLGPELLAEAIEDLFDYRPIRQASPGAGVFLSLVVGGATVLVAATLRPLCALIAAGAIFAFYHGAVIASFVLAGLVLPMVTPGLCMILGYGLVAIVLLVSAERSVWKLRTSLGLYIPPAIAAEIASDPDAVRLDGERRMITVLVSDIKGFTRFAEGHPPETVVARLNEYFAAMTEVAWARGATVDKFIGDGLFLLFNAPQHQDDHALRAVMTAVEMIERLRELNKSWQARGWEPFGMRIAINSGEAIVGNMGALGRRVSYTAIGDAVNVTFYLERAAGKLGKDILLADSTYQLVRHAVVVEPIGNLRLGGRRESVKVYSVTALATPKTAATGEGCTPS
jgi:adenylate cyclase